MKIKYRTIFFLCNNILEYNSFYSCLILITKEDLKFNNIIEKLMNFKLSKFISCYVCMKSNINNTYSYSSLLNIKTIFVLNIIMLKILFFNLDLSDPSEPEIFNLV